MPGFKSRGTKQDPTTNKRHKTQFQLVQPVDYDNTLTPDSCVKAFENEQLKTNKSK